MSQLQIFPSLLAANFAALGEDMRCILEAGGDGIHLDVMDGHFVPNISFGPAVIAALRPLTQAFFDVHLMIAPADPYLEDFAKAGANRITLHVEAGPHVHRSLQKIRSLGVKAGVALNPATPLEALTHLLEEIDLILMMTVNPGFGGQHFITNQLPKIHRARKMVEGREIMIEVDGGVHAQNAREIAQAGADILVAGSAAFKGGPAHYVHNLTALRE